MTRTDTERLDWLARRGQSARQWENGWVTLIRWSGKHKERRKTLRSQIDAAIAAEEAAQNPATKAPEFGQGFLRASL